MKNGKQIFKIFSLFLVGLLLLTACGGNQTTGTSPAGSSSSGSDNQKETANSETPQTSDSQEKIVLKIADSLPAQHQFTTQGTFYFMERVQELTNGRVEFEHFPSEQLGKAKDMINVAQTGTADIAYWAAAYGEQTPLTTLSELPGFFDNSLEGSIALHNLAHGMLYEEEYDKLGLRPTFVMMYPPYNVVTKKPIDSLSDMKGLKLRTTGGLINITLEEIGAVPISLPFPEVYESVERGVIDGGLMSVLSVPSYSLEEVLNSLTLNGAFGGSAAIWVMNEQSYNQLPPDIQEAILQASEEATIHLAEYQDNSYDELIEELESKHQWTTTTFPENEVEQMIEMSDKIFSEWKKQMIDRGISEKTVDKLYDEFVNEVQKARDSLK